MLLAGSHAARLPPCVLQVQENTLIVCHASRNDIILGYFREHPHDAEYSGYYG